MSSALERSADGSDPHEPQVGLELMRPTESPRIVHHGNETRRHDRSDAWCSTQLRNDRFLHAQLAELGFKHAIETLGLGRPPETLTMRPAQRGRRQMHAPKGHAERRVAATGIPENSWTNRSGLRIHPAFRAISRARTVAPELH